MTLAVLTSSLKEKIYFLSNLYYFHDNLFISKHTAFLKHFKNKFLGFTAFPYIDLMLIISMDFKHAKLKPTHEQKERNRLPL